MLVLLKNTNLSSAPIPTSGGPVVSITVGAVQEVPTAQQHKGLPVRHAGAVQSLKDYGEGIFQFMGRGGELSENVQVLLSPGEDKHRRNLSDSFPPTSLV